MWNVLECGGSGREKRGKKGGKKKEKRVRVHMWRRKKEGGKKKEIWIKKKRNKGKIK